MMRILFALCVFFCFSHTLRAQVWIDSGAVWHYDVASFGAGIDGFRRVKYTKDTIIQGHNCQKIETEEYAFGIMNSMGDYGIISQFYLDAQYTYTSGDTVFYFDHGEFFVLYNFGAAIGDSWIISTSPNPMDPQCPDTSVVNVVDTGSLVLNGISYRTITIESASVSAYSTQATIVERFGAVDMNSSRHAYLFPVRQMCSIVIMEVPMFSFKCFTDRSFSLYNPSGQDCEYLLNILDTKDYQKDVWSVHPNPAKTITRLSGRDLAGQELVIFDILGQLVQKKSITYNEFVLDLSSFEKGLYFLKVKDSDVIQKLVVE